MTRYTPLMLNLPSSPRWPLAFAISGQAASYLAHASGISPDASISLSLSHMGSAEYFIATSGSGRSKVTGAFSAPRSTSKPASSNSLSLVAGSASDIGGGGGEPGGGDAGVCL